MCAACDAGLPCENGGMGCNVNAFTNPLIDAIRGASRPITSPVGRMAAGCAVRPAGATAIEYPNPYPTPSFGLSKFNADRYTQINKRFGFNSSYRRWPRAGAGTDENADTTPPAPQPARQIPVVPIALTLVAAWVLWKVVS